MYSCYWTPPEKGYCFTGHMANTIFILKAERNILIWANIQ